LPAHTALAGKGLRQQIVEPISLILLFGLYGADYVPSPYIQRLMELNGGVTKDLVHVKDEVRLFEDHEYLGLQASTMRRARFFL
jgi:hypothetical protein